MIDYKQLCVELVEALNLNGYYDEQADNMAYATLFQRVRAGGHVVACKAFLYFTPPTQVENV